MAKDWSSMKRVDTGAQVKNSNRLNFGESGGTKDLQNRIVQQGIAEETVNVKRAQSRLQSLIESDHQHLMHPTMPPVSTTTRQHAREVPREQQ